jgi:hypothetical protein
MRKAAPYAHQHCSTPCAGGRAAQACWPKDAAHNTRKAVRTHPSQRNAAPRPASAGGNVGTTTHTQRQRRRAALIL